MGARGARDDARERGLARPGRAPEDHGGHGVAFNGAAQGAFLAQNVFLAHEPGKVAGPHALGQGRQG